MNQQYMSIRFFLALFITGLCMTLTGCKKSPEKQTLTETKEEIELKMKELTLDEKIGQLYMADYHFTTDSAREVFYQMIRDGKIGGVKNLSDPMEIQKIQQIAVNESRSGIPLLIASDTIHGLGTVFPHPFNISCSWNPGMVKEATDLSARFGTANNIHLTFAPMASITRDPRWTLTMKGFGEDPMLVSLLSRAMVDGLQGNSIENRQSMAACAIQYIGIGNDHQGGNYGHAWIPRVELRNYYLPPYKALVEANVAALMVSGGAMNTIPVSTNKYLLQKILEEEWGYRGIVMSNSMENLVNNIEEVTITSIHAGIDMEVESNFFQRNLAKLLNEGKIKQDVIDNALEDILRMKYRMALENRITRDTSSNNDQWPQAFYKLSKQLSDQSLVLLKNNNNLLPLSKNLTSISIYGNGNKKLHTIDAPFDFLKDSVKSPMEIIQEKYSGITINHVELVEGKELNTAILPRAKYYSRNTSVNLVFIKANDTGASDLSPCKIPGARVEMVKEIADSPRPLVVVVQGSRPIVLTPIEPFADAILFGGYTGVATSESIVDVLFGEILPSGRLSMTFPKGEGQVPIYYNWTGVSSTDNPGKTSIPGYTPLYPFGYGLNYSNVTYDSLVISPSVIHGTDNVNVYLNVKNTGDSPVIETIQCYLHDPISKRIQPYKKLIAFKRVGIEPGEDKNVTFRLSTNNFGFFKESNKYHLEKGKFMLFVGPNANEGLAGQFTLE
jgi:beta-glucosidase